MGENMFKGIGSANLFFLCLSDVNYRNLDDFYFQRMDWSSNMIRILKADLNSLWHLPTFDQRLHVNPLNLCILNNYQKKIQIYTIFYNSNIHCENFSMRQTD